MEGFNLQPVVLSSSMSHRYLLPALFAMSSVQMGFNLEDKLKAGRVPDCRMPLE